MRQTLLVQVAVAVACWGLLAAVSPAEEDVDQELVALVVELLFNDDKQMRALGLEQVRSAAPGKSATQQFAAQLERLSPGARVSLLNALADRADRAARPEVVRFLDKRFDEATRVAAIGAVATLAQPPDDVQLLISVLAEGDAAEQSAASLGLTQMQGASVSTTIGAQLAEAEPPVGVKLINILTVRRALDSMPALLTAALHSEPSVRTAAMRALGELAGPQHLAGMLQGVLAAADGAERAAAEKRVMFVCQRIPAQAERAVPLLEAMQSLSSADRLALLPTLGRVGGPSARRPIEEAIASADATSHAMGIRGLCNWPDASVAPRLIELAQGDEHVKHRRMALKALIRVAPLPDDRPDSQRLALLKNVMQMCMQDKDRNRVLQRASAIRTPETLRFVVPYLTQAPHVEQACETVVELAHHRHLREPHEAEFHRALDTVIATSTNATLIDRAERYKRDETWVRPKAP